MACFRSIWWHSLIGVNYKTNKTAKLHGLKPKKWRKFLSPTYHHFRFFRQGNFPLSYATVANCERNIEMRSSQSGIRRI